MKSFLIFFIHCYQKTLSRAFPRVCRFEPTCSRYACTAVEKYGVIKGGYLAFRRLLRCHPFHPGGIDPVP